MVMGGKLLTQRKLPIGRLAYETEFDIHVNQRNPQYQYPSTNMLITNKVIEGMYSKEDDYNIDATTGQATFYVDPVNSFFHIGLIYKPPYSGTYQQVNQTLSVCCNDYLGSRLKDVEVMTNAESFLNVFPNPNNGSQLVLHYQFKNKGKATIEIYNLLGKKIVEKIATIDDATLETHETIDLGKLPMQSGFYMVRITNGSEVVSSKLLINK